MPLHPTYHWQQAESSGCANRETASFLAVTCVSSLRAPAVSIKRKQKQQEGGVAICLLHQLEDAVPFGYCFMSRDDVRFVVASPR